MGDTEDARTITRQFEVVHFLIQLVRWPLIHDAKDELLSSVKLVESWSEW